MSTGAHLRQERPEPILQDGDNWANLPRLIHHSSTLSVVGEVQLAKNVFKTVARHDETKAPTGDRASCVARPVIANPRSMRAQEVRYHEPQDANNLPRFD